MAKSSAQKTLQKIHTYAGDIEAVRNSHQPTKPVVAKADEVPKIPSKTSKKVFENTPSIIDSSKTKTDNTELLIPTKPKLPAIRTMGTDSQSTKQETIHPVKLKKPEIKEPVVIPNPAKNISPSKKAQVEKTEESKSEIKSESKTKTQKPIVSTDTAKVASVAKPNTAHKQTRDATYTATVITDTKHKRFSLWKELTKKLSPLFKKSPKTKKADYVAPNTPLRKGVVQSATTNTARKTIADYSTIKTKIKSRPLEESENIDNTSDTTKYSINADQENEDLEKTRFELLSSIEKEVGSIDDKLPEYLSPIRNNDEPILDEANKSDQNINKAAETLTWEHYIESEEEIIDPIVTDDLTSDKKLNPSEEDRDQKLSNNITSPEIKLKQTAEASDATPAKTSPIPYIVPKVPTSTNNLENIQLNASTQGVNDTQEYQPQQNFNFDEETNTNYSEPTSVPGIEEHSINTDLDNEITEQKESINSINQSPDNFLNETTDNLDTETPTENQKYFYQPKIEPIIPSWSHEDIDKEELPATIEANDQLKNTFHTASAQNFGTENLAPQILATETPDKVIQNTKSLNFPVSFIKKYTRTFILFILISASVITIGAIIGPSLITQFTNGPSQTTYHNYFNSSTIHSVAVTPLNSLTITEKIINHNNSIGVSEITIENSDSTPITTITLTQVLNLPLNPTFNASLEDIRFGWYREEPFIVLKYSGDSVARGALLQWERTLYRDLMTLFGLNPISPTMLGVFKDVTFENKDVRVLYTNSGEEKLVYGIVTSGHIIITTSELSFLNLSSNFNPKQ